MFDLAGQQFLRLGVACAVIEDDGRVLLSQRGDLGVWNLPGGRPDSGELLADAAAREVREETGILAHVEQPIGLYYWQGWQRLNIVYTALPIGGVLQGQTDETRDNRYFAPGSLPDMQWAFTVQDALAEKQSELRVIHTPPDEHRRVKWALYWRWIKNFLRGQPEPKHVPFDVRAVGLVWDSAHRRVLALRDGRDPMLPRVGCNGRRAPWEQLQDFVAQRCQVRVSWRWVGLWQDTARDAVEFVFAATTNKTVFGEAAEWLSAQNSALMGREREYIERVKVSYMTDKVWFIHKPPTGGYIRTINRP